MKNYLKNLLLISSCFLSVQLYTMVPQVPKATASLDTRGSDLRATALKVQLTSLKVRNLIAAINQDNLPGVRCHLDSIESLKNKNLELVQAAIAQLYARCDAHKDTAEKELARIQIIDLLQAKFPGIDPEEYCPLRGNTADSAVMAMFAAAHAEFFDSELDKFMLVDGFISDDADSKEVAAVETGLVGGRSLLTPKLTPRSHAAHAAVDSPRRCDSALELLARDRESREVSCSPSISSTGTPRAVTGDTPS